MPNFLCILSCCLTAAVLLTPLSYAAASRPVPPFPPNIQSTSSSEDSRIVPSTQQASNGQNQSIDTQLCGTAPPSTFLRAVASQLSHARQLEKRGINDAPEILSRLRLQKRIASNVITVNTYFHIVSTMDQARFYTSKVRANIIQTQAAALNVAYRSSNIIFHLMTPTYTIKDDWATDANSTAMKQALRKGSYAALNVYFQTNLSSYPNSAGAPTLLGYCTLPTSIIYTYGGQQYEYPAYDYATDGCNVLAASMPGAPFSVYGYDRGKTAVHEIGHWFGLLHTFQDQTCAPSDPGDYIDDTPQEASSTVGCPIGKDSCPGDPGLDPINNYMDYSTDECYTGFTPDQRQRMQDMFNTYRAGY